jgi:hypothetical protein
MVCSLCITTYMPNLRVAGQTFGVDLEARARADRKRVPLVITTILTYLDNRELL